MGFVGIFNRKGLEEFSNYISECFANDDNVRRMKILTEEINLEEKIKIEIDENKKFDTAFEMGKYFFELFSREDQKKIFMNQGLWNWISCLYLPILRKDDVYIGKDSRVRLEEGWLWYRHLTHFSWYVYQKYKEKSFIFLESKSNNQSLLCEQIGGRQDFLSNDNIIDAFICLYWDKENKKFKRGYTNKKSGIKRFGTILNQFALNYDFYSMTYEQIVDLLPEEFNELKNLKK